MALYIYILYVKGKISILIAVNKLSCVNIYKRPHNGTYLELKHVAMNKLIKSSIVCD